VFSGGCEHRNKQLGKCEFLDDLTRLRPLNDEFDPRSYLSGTVAYQHLMRASMKCKNSN
jgi:hypothetical protein